MIPRVAGFLSKMRETKLYPLKPMRLSLASEECPAESLMVRQIGVSIIREAFPLNLVKDVPLRWGDTHRAV